LRDFTFRSAKYAEKRKSETPFKKMSKGGKTVKKRNESFYGSPSLRKPREDREGGLRQGKKESRGESL